MGSQTEIGTFVCKTLSDWWCGWLGRSLKLPVDEDLCRQGIQYKYCDKQIQNIKYHLISIGIFKRVY